jgi:chorismate mutase
MSGSKILNISSDKAFVIAGPCSAETRDQMINTAIGITQSGKVNAIRAGLWKPRTRPDSFGGVGEVGLPWLKELKTITGLPVATEVANAAHVEKCLEYNIDILWIGARTTVNPFSVQEIADAIKGSDVTVMIKNPMSPDLHLWLGATERILKAGPREVAAIHRGFFNSGEKKFRNRPYWQIAIDYRQHLPEVPLLCDPSHMGGKRELIFDLSQKALDLQYDGLMIESHIHPEEAWSDAFQQITPDALQQVLNRLIIRDKSNKVRNGGVLESLRKELSLIDDELLHVLGNRFRVIRELAAHKKQKNITIYQPEIYKVRQTFFKEKGVENNLSDTFIKRLIRSIHDESIDQQEEIFNK